MNHLTLPFWPTKWMDDSRRSVAGKEKALAGRTSLTCAEDGSEAQGVCRS